MDVYDGNRTATTQNDFARQQKVHPSTLSKWKQLPGFHEAVMERVRAGFGWSMPDIYAALVRGARKENAQLIKLAMEMAGEHTDRQKIEHEGEVTFHVVYDNPSEGADTDPAPKTT